jgi:hypothetical protein
VTSTVVSALTERGVRSAAYLTDATIRLFDPLRGESGSLRAHVAPPGDTLVADSLPTGAGLEFASSDTTHPTDAPTAPEVPGLWRLAVRVGDVLSPVTGFNVITLTPITSRRDGRIGLYYIGRWPTERGVRRSGYTTPSGLIEVTLENRDTRVSDHFTLGDFLTKGQEDVWPKYLVLDMRLVDKLELVIQELEDDGHVVERLRVMSGFRTPSYNATGGDPRGRASLSRHMYGDAADVFVDNDGDGRTDDLDGDGRVTIADAQVMARAAERVEREHPRLVGGIGVYSATASHGPFMHVDTRGYRARWLGTGDS